MFEGHDTTAAGNHDNSLSLSLSLSLSSLFHPFLPPLSLSPSLLFGVSRHHLDPVQPGTLSSAPAEMQGRGERHFRTEGHTGVVRKIVDVSLFGYSFQSLSPPSLPPLSLLHPKGRPQAADLPQVLYQREPSSLSPSICSRSRVRGRERDRRPHLPERNKCGHVDLRRSSLSVHLGEPGGKLE